jgi:tetrahydromethanopterin S-methyltransferase subunit G
MKVMHGDSVEARVGALDVKVDELEHRMTECFEHVDERFEQVDRRFEQVDKRFETFEADLRELRRDTKLGFDAITNRLDGLNDKLDRTNRFFIVGVGTLTAGYMAGFAGLITLVATQI